MFTENSTCVSLAQISSNVENSVDFSQLIDSIRGSERLEGILYSVRISRTMQIYGANFFSEGELLKGLKLAEQGSQLTLDQAKKEKIARDHFQP